jgi:hypothetical protein
MNQSCVNSISYLGLNLLIYYGRYIEMILIFTISDILFTIYGMIMMEVRHGETAHKRKR